MNKNDLISGGIFMGLGICILGLTFPFPSLDKGHPGPALFPNILAVLFIFFGGFLLGKRLKSRIEPIAGPEEKAPPQVLGNAFFALGIILAFLLLESTLGFLLTSFFLLFVFTKKLGTSLFASAVSSILITVFVYFLFYKVLRVPLSPGLLSW